jgi:hypothetical protein
MPKYKENREHPHKKSVTQAGHDGSSLSVILATWKAEVRRIKAQGQAGQKVHKPHLNQWLGFMVCSSSPVIPSYRKKHKQEDCGLGWT